jgi:uncharacterized heparinase superfamily protein
MSALRQKLKRVRNRSLREIAVRGRQELGKLGERVYGAGELSDRGLLKEIAPSSRNCSGQGSALLILERIRRSLEKRQLSENETSEPTLFCALAARGELVELIERRFSAEREAIIDRAERSLRGRFDLLGFSNLSFGDPIDWLLEPISGKRTSLTHWSRIDYLNAEVAGDKKITWELNRHGHFITLGQAYVVTKDERYAQGFVRQAEAWMDANPPGRGINWASSLEIAFRSISWLWALHLFAESPALTSTFLARFLKVLIANGRHVEAYLSQYFSPNTHLTGEALGLFYLGVLLPELRRADGWRKAGLRILLEQLPRHVRGDGVYFEQSSYYHRYTTDFYLHFMLLARTAAVELSCELKSAIASMLDHLMWITRPDGSSPQVGDDDGGRLVGLGSRPANDFRDTLAIGAALLGRADWKFVAGEAGIEALWLLGPDGLRSYDEIRPRAPEQSSKAFEDGGYYVMRDGWREDSTYALIDCGPHGAIGGGHAHADALALEFASGGTTWLVDPGTYTYTGDCRERDWFRSTEAHNTATVDGQSQSVPGGPFSWKRSAKSAVREFIQGIRFDYFEGSHDGYERLADPVNHTRSVLLVKSGSKAPGYLIVRDSFSGQFDHRYSIRYHLATGSQAKATNEHIVATKGGRTMGVSSFSNSEQNVSVVAGWVSRCYGQRQEAPVALIESRGSGPQEFVSFIVPAPTGGAPWLPPRINNAPLIGPSAGSCKPPIESATGNTSAADAGAATERRPYSFAVHSGDFVDAILLGDGTEYLTSPALSARASVAFARFGGGREEGGIADCGLRIADFRMRGSVRGIADCGLRIADLEPRALNRESKASDRLVSAFLVCGDRLEVSGIKFKSSGQVSYCEIEICEDSVELTIAGAERFELILPEDLRKLRLNGSPFELRPGQRNFEFRIANCEFVEV